MANHPTPLSAEQLDELERLAKAAIYGEWFESGDLRYSDDKTGEVHGLNVEDDRYIAAANPATLLSLLAEFRQLRDTVDAINENAANVIDDLHKEINQLRADAERLNFILVKSRKVVIECLPRGQKEVYVEEGFMSDKRYPAVAHSGEWVQGSPADLELKRRAIDAAINHPA